MKNANIVANNLKDILQRRGMSQKELAEKAGVWPQQVNAWIKGRDNISAKNLRRLAAVLEVGVESLTADPEEYAFDFGLSQAELIKDLFLTLKRIERRLDADGRTVAERDSGRFIYEILFNKFPWGISVSDLDGKIISANERLCALLQLTREEILSKHAEEFYTQKKDRARLLSMLERDDVKFNFETEVIRADGTTIWINLNVKKISVYGKEYLVALAEDITEIKKAEHASCLKNNRTEY